MNGRSLAWSSLKDAIALWMLLVGLRLAWLLRPDGSGHPLVTDAFDYIPGAAALEWLATVPLTVPVLLLGLLAGRRAIPRLSTTARALLLVAGALVLAASVVDMETLRFTGNHLTLSLARANANGAAVRETLAILSSDPGGAYGGPLLLALVLVVWSAGRLRAWRAARRRPVEVSGRRLAAAVAAMGLTVSAAFWLAPNLSSRAWRMAPASVVALREWRARPAAEIPQDQLARLAERYRQDWRDGADPVVARRWVFPRAEYPLFRVTRQEACRAGEAAPGPECAADRDGDGFALREDCDDEDKLTHPGAQDLPGDGVDQDCSGVDRDPWNVILVVLESERAASVGHLAPWGARVRGLTPTVDALAASGTTYTRVWTNGLPTTAAFMSIHTGLEPHPSRVIAKELTTLAIDAFPRLLAERGFVTRYFSTPAPDWDNSTFWAWSWYHDVVHVVRAAADEKAFGAASRWLRFERPVGRPFLATILTGSNHFPFRGGAHPEIVPQGLDVAERMKHTMRWVDGQLGVFLDSIRREPFFPHTLVIVTGDHGFPLGEHGSYRLGENLLGESTWVPLVIAGDHPKRRARGAVDDRPASHVDVAPTILDLLGVEAANASSGHSLARPAGDPSPLAFLVSEMAIARGDLRAYLSRPGSARPSGEAVFETAHDRLDQTPGDPTPAWLEWARASANARFQLLAWAYEHDRVLPYRPRPTARPGPSSR